MLGRACTYLMPSGRPCKATPLRDEPFCFWQSPETAEEAAEARRVGGLHRRKKKTVGAIYGFHGLRTIDDNLALLERPPARPLPSRTRLLETVRWADLPPQARS